jgi:hypothetical protein
LNFLCAFFALKMRLVWVTTSYTTILDSVASHSYYINSGVAPSVLNFGRSALILLIVVLSFILYDSLSV